MINHYAVLEIESGATSGEVRSAFRRMAKKYHPDLNGHRQKWAHVRMRKVLDAYEVLADTARRSAYDDQLSWFHNSQRDRYRERLASKSDPKSRAKLILYDLLQGSASGALLTYEAALAEDPGFLVQNHLAPRDWMVCKFLLAEEYERRKAYVRALNLYEEIYHSHLAAAHYKRFLSEVADRIRNLCCRDLARSVGPAEAILYYQRALAMNQRRTERAFLHKKLAESYHRLEDRDQALEHMRTALDIKPDLKGCQKICQKLGIEREA